jgi:hypothetical protein
VSVVVTVTVAVTGTIVGCIIIVVTVSVTVVVTGTIVGCIIIVVTVSVTVGGCFTVVTVSVTVVVIVSAGAVLHAPNITTVIVRNININTFILTYFYSPVICAWSITQPNLKYQRVLASLPNLSYI